MTKDSFQYSKEYLDKILNQEVEISLIDEDSDEDQYAYKGKIISYNSAEENTNVPVDFYFHSDHGNIKRIKMKYLKGIRIL
ncbi:hypothetical protein E9993_11775 [Labilibacter sediminis]|nr:hypothetical protein E9993_11775 [Labilibacter sediminis]